MCLFPIRLACISTRGSQTAVYERNTDKDYRTRYDADCVIKDCLLVPGLAVIIHYAVIIDSMINNHTLI